MADDNLSLLTEAYNRGILPPDQSAAYEEAQRRGLLGTAPAPTSSPSPGAVAAPGAVPDAQKGIVGRVVDYLKGPSALEQSAQVTQESEGMPLAERLKYKMANDPVVAGFVAPGGEGSMALKPAATAATKFSAVIPERAALAQEAMQDFNIPLTAPQIGVSKGAKFVADTLPGGEAQQLATKQAFVKAVSNTMGEDAPAITQTVMDNAKRRIGGVMNRIEDSTDVSLEHPDTMAAFTKIENNASKTLTPDEYSVVKKQMDNVFSNVQQDGSITGETYGNLLRKDGPLDRAISNSNSNISRFAGDVKEALQDALERSMEAKAPTPERAMELENLLAQGKARLENMAPGGANKEMVSTPSGYKFLDVDPKALAAQNAKYEAELYGAQRDLAAYKQARFQYKNMKTIEPLVNKAPDGMISPALLNERVTKQFPNRAYDASGKNPLDRLAKIGQAFLKEPQSTASGERAATLGALSKFGHVAGAAITGGAAAAAGVLPEAAVAAAAAYGGGRAVGAFMRRPAAAQTMIRNGLLSRPASLQPPAPAVHVPLSLNALNDTRSRRNQLSR